MAMQYLGLLWEGLMVGLLLRLPRRPMPPRASYEQPRRRWRLCSSIPMLQWAIDLDRCYKQPPSRVRSATTRQRLLFPPIPPICEPKMDGRNRAPRAVGADPSERQPSVVIRGRSPSPGDGSCSSSLARHRDCEW